MADIILERAKMGFCPICNRDTPMYKETLKDYIQVEYKGKKVTVHKEHVKGVENDKTK